MARRASAEINLAALERNVRRVRGWLAPGTRLCAVVKADAYGHGALAVSHTALAAGAAMLAVATAGEALELRAGGVRAPILVLGAISDEELGDALAARATLVAWDPRFVRALRHAAVRAQQTVCVHIKLDTGLGRLGTRSLRTAAELADAVIAAAPALRLTGAMTHFATADGDLDFAAAQLARFTPFVARLRALPGGERLTVHAASSAGTLRVAGAMFDMARAGIVLYGGDPMNVDPAAYGLEPVLALRSYVAALKEIAPGESTGYGRRFVSPRRSLIATLPIGYGDGLPRALANNCDVLIGGRRYPLCGMVSMDNITVDVGPGAPVELGQRATIIGADGAERQTAEDLAHRLDTISYEVLCLISRRVPRSYHRDGAPVADAAAAAGNAGATHGESRVPALSALTRRG